MNNKKHIIICIVGASGSGKTTLTIELYKHYKIPYVCSYTTRPMRPDETNNVEHRFVSDNDIPNKSDICAYTKFGGYQYWTTFSQIEENPISTYIIDEAGIEYFNKNCGDRYKVYYVKVIRDNLSEIDKDRLERDKDRPTESYTYDCTIYNNGTINDMLTQFMDWYNKVVINGNSTVYISIPIANLDWSTQENKANNYEKKLKELGFNVFNPFKIPAPIHDKSPEETYAYYMGESIKKLLISDYIMMTPNWEESKGCRTEFQVAKIYGIQEIPCV